MIVEERTALRPICPRCGAPLRRDGSFCPACGLPVSSVSGRIQPHEAVFRSPFPCFSAPAGARRWWLSFGLALALGLLAGAILWGGFALLSQRAGEENPWNGGQGALADAFAPYSVGESVLVECYQPDASFSELPCQAELTLNALWTGEEALNYVREAGGDPTVLGPGEEFRVARFQIRLLKSAGNTAFFSSNNFWAADGRKAYENYNPAGGNPQLLSLRPEESEEITVCAVVQKESDALFYFFTTTGYVCFVSR